MTSWRRPGSLLQQLLLPLLLLGAAHARRHHRRQSFLNTGAPQHSDGAYVFVASLGEPSGQYWDLILASMQCLQQTGPAFDVGVIWDGERSDKVYESFAALNVSVFQYPEYFQQRGVDLALLNATTWPAVVQDWYWKKAWNKLLAWTLTQYSKVVALDPDVITWSNPDGAFDYPELAAVPDYLLQTTDEEHSDIFNAGVVVLEPSTYTWGALMARLAAQNGTEWFQEQGLLNDHYQHRWHMLPLAYNMWPKVLQRGVSKEEPVAVVKLVHHVAESACGDCDLGTKMQESCAQHVCPDCCLRVVQCREAAHERIRQYQQRKQEQEQEQQQGGGEQAQDQPQQQEEQQPEQGGGGEEAQQQQQQPQAQEGGELGTSDD